MLVELAIRDIVLIDRLSLGFNAGMSVLTGETGAFGGLEGLEDRSEAEDVLAQPWARRGIPRRRVAALVMALHLCAQP